MIHYLKNKVGVVDFAKGQGLVMFYNVLKFSFLLKKNSLLKKVLMAVMKSAPSTELPVLGLALSFNFKPRFSLHTEDQNRPNFYEFCLKIFIPDILKVKKMGLVETD